MLNLLDSYGDIFLCVIPAKAGIHTLDSKIHTPPDSVSSTEWQKWHHYYFLLF